MPVIKIKKPSDCLESEVTPEHIYQQRRKFIKSTSLLAVAGLTFQGKLMAQAKTGAGLSKAQLAGSDLKDEVTPFKDVSRYNNFYEFGTDKSDPAKYAKDFDTSGWTVEVSGECARPGRLDLEDLIAGVDVEDRIYRLRCVEAWSMVVPWRGVELGRVLKKFEPTSKAKYVAFRTLLDPERMPGQKRPVLQWPYREGLRMDEAMHPLTLLSTGMYGKDMPNQNGAPVRLVVPWKYGFKSIKSIVSIEFTESQPETSWNMSQASEYGFYSNVNPEVSHPRWSQARERRIGEFFKRETLMFNGYADEVASLYSGMDLRKSF